MAISVEQVKELRDATGAGVLEAKKALEAANGDFDQAVNALREKGLAKAAKKAGREANEGRIEVYEHLGSRIGVMVEVNCETDFVARNEQFTELAHDIALQIAAMSPSYVTRDEVPQEIIENEKEVLRKQAEAEGKPPQVVEKIVEGRLSKFYADEVLLDQPFIRDEKMTIQDLLTDAIRQLGENILVRRFTRYELGESAE